MFHVDEVLLDLIARGRITVLGLYGPSSEFSHLVDKDVVLYFEKKRVPVTITEVRHYPTLELYLKKEGWKNLHPNLNSYEEVYDSYMNGQEYYPNSPNIERKTLVERKGGMNALILSIR